MPVVPDSAAGGFDILTVNEFIDAALVSDPYLAELMPDPFNTGKSRIYPFSVPEDVQYPSAVFLPLAFAADSVSEGGYRVSSNMIFAFSVIGAGLLLTSQMANIYARIDQVLQNAAGSFPHGIVVTCMRQSPWGPPISQDGGQLYNRIGGSYLFIVQSLPDGVPNYIVVGGSSYQLRTEIFNGPATTVTISRPYRILVNCFRNGQAVFSPEGWDNNGQDFTPNPPLLAPEGGLNDEFVVEYYG